MPMLSAAFEASIIWILCVIVSCARRARTHLRTSADSSMRQAEEVPETLVISDEVHAHVASVCRLHQDVSTGPFALLMGVKSENDVVCMGIWLKSDLKEPYTIDDCAEAQKIYPPGIGIVGVVYSSNAARLSQHTVLQSTLGFALSYYGEKLSGWHGQSRRPVAKLFARDVAERLTSTHSIIRLQHTMLGYLVHDTGTQALQRCKQQLLTAIAQEIRTSSIIFGSGYTVDLADSISAHSVTSVEDCLGGVVELELAKPSEGNGKLMKTKKDSRLKRAVKKLKHKKRSPQGPGDFHSTASSSHSLHKSFRHNAWIQRRYGAVTDIQIDLPPRVNCVPEYIPQPVYTSCIPLTVEIVAYCQSSDDVIGLSAVLERSLLFAYTDLVQRLEVEDIAAGDRLTSTELRMLQFEPDQTFCPIGATFKLKRGMRPLEIHEHGRTYEWDTSWEDDEQLLEQRRKLHLVLGIPLYRPVFRAVCAADLTTNEVSPLCGDHLVDVHVGIPAPAMHGARTFLVDGHYAYYHYMQGGINDRGWGCAYRSLQTIVSWFRLNRYTDIAVPTHTDIQRALVRTGDKPSTFVGSQDWIGSLEVGFYLGEVLGVEWKNVMVNSGPALATKARELAAHFETEGTPVMMGGGNLALTLLGVSWNEDTGDVMFLVLDPHYIGADDILTIQEKEVTMEGTRAIPCGWRSPQSFSRTTFYSLCLPKRPATM